MDGEALIDWRTAVALGLSPARVLDLRLERRRDGKVYFIQELVEYHDGRKGWRPREGLSVSGDYGPLEFGTEKDAEAEMLRARRSMAITGAMRVLGDDFRPRNEFPFIVLGRLWDGTDPPPDADALVALYRRQQAVTAAALKSIGGGPGRPKRGELARAFQDGHRSVGQLVAWWRSELERRAEAKRLRELEARKARERAERREREDAFLRAKAAGKAEADGVAFPGRAALSLVGRSAPGAEWAPRDPGKALDRIAERLEERPYLRHVLGAEDGYLRLYQSEDGLGWKEWGRFEKDARKRQIAERAEIADGLGEDPKDHWGRVRGRLLKRLKPGELDMLHRADVQEALEKARAEGRTLVVIRHLAFLWDEEAGEWRPREVVRRGGAGSRGDALWVEGPIVSTNHGRVIVLPHVRADGTQVNGHTRNPPHEGEAPPRAQTKVIRFAVYDDLGRDDTWDYHGNVILPD